MKLISISNLAFFQAINLLEKTDTIITIYNFKKNVDEIRHF